MQDRDALEREVEHLRQRVAQMQRKLALFSRTEPVTQVRAGLEISLEEREELLEEAERLAHLGTWVWNVETDSVYWSAELFRLLGYDPARDLASTEAFFAALHPDDRERLRAVSASSVASGVAVQENLRILTRDGVVRHVTMEAAFLFDDASKLRRVVGAVLDITQLRGLEEQLVQAEKMEAIGRLAAGVAHDFNNVLTVVRGNLDLACLPATHELKQVFAALESAADLTTKLLTLGRRSPLRRRTVDLSVLVQKTVALVERMLREQIALRVHVSEAAMLVDVDETSIEQALVNLLLNARDALAGGGSVDVTVAPASEGGRAFVELTVQDDGPGMSDAMRTRVFDPFFTTKAHAAGHGLGLSMVHGTVAQHGGTVTVESEPGRGTAFRLRFPRVAGEHTQHGENSPERAVERAEPCSVLVVEDQELVGLTIRRLLEHLGHRVEFAATPEHALGFVRRAHFDVILCDVMMPEMRGPALIDKMRGEVPGAAAHVIFMTGNSADVVDTSEELLTKPFTIHQLRDAIARTCVSPTRAAPHG